MRNPHTIRNIKALTEEERSLHLHYTVEFLEENIKELYDIISEDLDSERSIHRIAFLSDISDRIERMLEK
jgi:hypothetical protein